MHEPLRHPLYSLELTITKLILLVALIIAASCSDVVSGQYADGVRPLCAGPNIASTTATMNCSNFSPTTGIILGWNVDLDRHDTITNVLQRMRWDRSPGAYGMFLKINSQLIGQTPLDLVKKEDLNDFLQQIRGRNAIFVVSCDPIDGYAAVTDEAINQFAAKMAEYNQYGIPVLIRPAHEMNGPWYAWGQQPTQYIAFHRKLHTAVRKVAPKTQFVFAPNLGVGYPWTIGEYHIQPTSPDFRLVDTNRDGVLSILDDPYTPYWPGGEYVDWFGFSTYYKGVSYPYVQNEQIPSDFVAGQLDQVLGGRESTYGFAARRNLPIVIPEMAGSYGIGNPGVTQLQIKRGFWQQVLGPEAHQKYPLIKLGLWFDYLKFEDNALRDFTISNTTTFAQIGPFFQADLTSYPHMLYESNLTLSTSGNCGCFRYNDRREALGKVPTTSSTTTTWTNTRTRETSTETDPGDVRSSESVSGVAGMGLRRVDVFSLWIVAFVVLFWWTA